MFAVQGRFASQDPSEKRTVLEAESDQERQQNYRSCHAGTFAWLCRGRKQGMLVDVKMKSWPEVSFLIVQ